MHLLSADEALNVSDAIMLTLYGEEMFMRWKELKHEMQFVSEREYISWLIDVAHHYKGGSDENNTQSDVWQNMASEEEGVKCEGDGRDVGQYYGKRQRLGSGGHMYSDMAPAGLKDEDEVEAESCELVLSDEDDGGSDVEETGVMVFREGGEGNSDASWNCGSGVRPPDAGEKERHMCVYCSYSSVYKGDVRRHMKAVHLKLKPHACQYCSYTASLSHHLKKHMRNWHPHTLLLPQT